MMNFVGYLMPLARKFFLSGGSGGVFQPKERMTDLIECPNCGSPNLLVYEYYHIFRTYPQNESGIDSDRFDEEYFPKEEPLTIKRLRCEHEWTSEEGAVIEDIIW
jgi:hypothetical protein